MDSGGNVLAWKPDRHRNVDPANCGNRASVALKRSVIFGVGNCPRRVVLVFRPEIAGNVGRNEQLRRPDGQITWAVFRPLCQGPLAKIFGFSEIANQFILTPSRPTEGRLAIVTDAGRDAVDADGAKDESTWGGRRSRVVLTPRRWRQVREKQASQG